MTESDVTSRETAALRAGDAGAFDQLYDRYASRVMGFGMRLTGGNRAEAEDLTQDTFLAAYAGRDGFAQRAKPLAYLLGITWRRWRDGRRRTAAISVEPLNEEIIPTVDPTAGVAVSVTLEAAMQRLDAPQREALLLTAVQGLTYAEAARILGEPVGTVKWRVHEGTREMRRMLNAAEERYEATRRQAAGSADPARCR